MGSQLLTFESISVYAMAVFYKLCDILYTFCTLHMLVWMKISFHFPLFIGDCGYYFVDNASKNH